MKEVAYVLKVLSQKDQLDFLFLDFEKAFDNVPHKRLLLNYLNMEFQAKLGFFG